MTLMEGSIDEEIEKTDPDCVDLAFGNPVRVPRWGVVDDGIGEHGICCGGAAIARYFLW